MPGLANPLILHLAFHFSLSPWPSWEPQNVAVQRRCWPQTREWETAWMVTLWMLWGSYFCLLGRPHMYFGGLFRFPALSLARRCNNPLHCLPICTSPLLSCLITCLRINPQPTRPPGFGLIWHRVPPHSVCSVHRAGSDALTFALHLPASRPLQRPFCLPGMHFLPLFTRPRLSSFNSDIIPSGNPSRSRPGSVPTVSTHSCRLVSTHSCRLLTFRALRFITVSIFLGVC